MTRANLVEVLQGLGFLNSTAAQLDEILDDVLVERRRPGSTEPVPRRVHPDPTYVVDALRGRSVVCLFVCLFVWLVGWFCFSCLPSFYPLHPIKNQPQLNTVAAPCHGGILKDVA